MILTSNGLNWNKSKDASKNTKLRKWGNNVRPWSFPVGPCPTSQSSSTDQYAVASKEFTVYREQISEIDDGLDVFLLERWHEGTG